MFTWSSGSLCLYMYILNFKPHQPKSYYAILKIHIYSKFQNFFVEGGLLVYFLLGTKKVHFYLQVLYSIRHSESKVKKCVLNHTV